MAQVPNMPPIPPVRLATVAPPAILVPTVPAMPPGMRCTNTPPAIPPVPRAPAPAIPPVPRAPETDSAGFPVLHGSYTGKPLTAADGGARISGHFSEGCVQVQCKHAFPIKAVRAMMAAEGVPFIGGPDTFCPERGLIVCHTCINPAGDAVYRWRS